MARDWSEWPSSKSQWLKATGKAWELGCECHRCKNLQRYEAAEIHFKEYWELAEVHFFADFDEGMIYPRPDGSVGVVHPFTIPPAIIGRSEYRPSATRSPPS